MSVIEQYFAAIKFDTTEVGIVYPMVGRLTDKF